MSDEEWDEECASFFEAGSLESSAGKSERKQKFQQSIALKKDLCAVEKLSEVERAINRDKAKAIIASNVMKKASKKEILKVAEGLKKAKNEVTRDLKVNSIFLREKNISELRNASMKHKARRSKRVSK